MSQEYIKRVGTGIAGKSQRVSVIKWSTGESTITSKEKPSLPIDEETSFLSSCPVKNLSNGNGAAKYHCLFCDKSFKWYSHWKSHERTHTGEKPFECETCGKAFARSDSLQSHQVTHISRNPSFFSPAHILSSSYWSEGEAHPLAEQKESVKPISKKEVSSELEQAKFFNCDHCNRIFFSCAGMLKHIQLHKAKGRRNLICEVCDKGFAKKSALEVHNRVHTGVKPYQCSICTKAFSIHGNLKRHFCIHTGERPHECSQCSSRFNNTSHLARHVKKTHKI